MAGVAVGRGGAEAQRLVVLRRWRRRQVVHSVAVVVLPLGLVVERLHVLMGEREGGTSGALERLNNAHHDLFPSVCVSHLRPPQVLPRLGGVGPDEIGRPLVRA